MANSVLHRRESEAITDVVELEPLITPEGEYFDTSSTIYYSLSSVSNLEIEQPLLNFTFQVVYENDSSKLLQLLQRLQEEGKLSDVINNKNYNGLSLLHQASSQYDDKLVKILCYYGADVNSLDNNIGATPLHYAVKYSKLETIQFLLEKGAEVNIHTSYSVDEFATPLHWLASRRLPVQNDRQIKECSRNRYLVNVDEETCNIVQTLIEKGAKPNETDDFNETPLHYAARSGNKEAIYALRLQEIVELDLPNRRRETALHMACMFDNPEICEMLISDSIISCDKQADITKQDFQLNTSLHHAAYMGSQKIIEMLVQKCRQLNSRSSEPQNYINTKNIYGDTAFTIALANENETIAKFLLDSGASVEILKNHNSVMHLACSNGKIAILKILLERNQLFLNQLNDDGETPLHVACFNNKLEAAKFLIQSGANISVKNKLGETSLIVCLKNMLNQNNEEIIDYLITIYFNNNLLEAQSALIACEFNNVYALELLLNRFVNFKHAVNVKRETPMHIAAKKGFTNVAECLMKRHPNLRLKDENGKTPLHFAAENAHFGIANLILEESADLCHEIDRDKNTPLHLAACFGNINMVEIFLTHDTCTNRLGQHSYTPLDWAAVRGHVNIIKTLLSSGSKIDEAPNSSKRTALHHACETSHCDSVKFLLKRGASLTKDSAGRSCLHVAIDNRQRDVIRVLLDKQTNDNWETLLRESRVCLNSCRITPVQELLQKNLHDLVVKVMDNCINTTSPLSLDKSYNFEFLDDTYICCADIKNAVMENAFDDKGVLKKHSTLYTKNIFEVICNHPLSLIAKISQQMDNGCELLAHPLVEKLLNHKWKYYRYIYFFELCIYLTFVALLTSYIAILPPPYQLPEFFYSPLNYCQRNETAIQNILMNKNDNNGFVYWSLLIFAVINVIKESLQFLSHGLIGYLDFQNFVEVPSYLFSFLFIFWNNRDSCSNQLGYLLPDQWIFGVVAVILAYINLIFMFKNFPFIGIYSVMFINVLKIFIKFLALFFMFVMAFAMAFYMLFSNQKVFNTFPSTIVKMLVMMVGEFDYTAIFYSHDREKVYYPIISHIVFFIFTLAMTILIMNLLIGLAVENINTIQSNSKLNELVLKADIVLETEFHSLMLDCIRRYVHIKELTETSDNFIFPLIRLLCPRIANTIIHGNKVKFAKYQDKLMAKYLMEKEKENFIRKPEKDKLDQILTQQIEFVNVIQQLRKEIDQRYQYYGRNNSI